MRPTGFAEKLISCINWFRFSNNGGADLKYQLLTGDAVFTETILTAFKDHYASKLRKVFSGLIPHHGSGGNFSKELFEAVDSCGVWVVSFGLGNRYKHPHAAVVDFFLDKEEKTS